MDIINEELIKIRDELFCLSFEINQIANLLLRNESERWVYGFQFQDTEDLHLSRYQFVSTFVENKRVLDIACGCGYGSYYLLKKGNAKQVQAVDRDESVIKYASIRYKHSNIQYSVLDAEDFNLDKFDVITSFETIEHLYKPENFLNNVKQSLKNEGLFFISTPISSIPYDSNPKHNKYHFQEWGFNSFHELISKYFSIQQIYLQIQPSIIFEKGKFIINGYKLLRNMNHITLKWFIQSICLSKKLTITPSIDFRIPILWNPKSLPNKYIGTIFQGYQIVVCKIR